MMIGVFDTCTSVDKEGKARAHSIFLCDECGIVAIERVWEDAGITWVFPDGATG